MSAAGTPRSLRIAIIAVGDELVAGDAAESNSSWLARRSRTHGHRVATIAVVGDDVPGIARAVQRAVEDADVVLMTGGLGPTVDDLTRDAVAAAFGVGLEERADLLAALEQHAARVQRSLDEGSRRQAQVPVGAEVLENPHGTAPGFLVRHVVGAGDAGPREVLLASMPGVPSEMRAMAGLVFERHLPDAHEFSAPRLLLAGITEAELGDRIADLMHHHDAGRHDARLGISAKRGVLWVTVRGNDPRAVAAMQKEVRARVGRALFGEGEDTLAGAVVGMLAGAGLTVSTAESCTGGLLAGAITSVPGSSDVFREGVVTYSNAAKAERLGVPEAMLAEHGAVSEPVAGAMAEGQRSRADADFALAVSGIAGPDGGTPDKPVGTVVIALAERGAAGRARTYGWVGTRDEIRARTVNVALEMLRRALLRRLQPDRQS